MGSALKVIKDELKKGRKDYMKEWSHGNAKHFESQGYYAWMSSFLPEKGTVLEVGTGDGRATLQLLKDGHTVISVDENIECLNSAENRLKSKGYIVARIKRETLSVSDADEGTYRIKYKKISNVPAKFDVLLVEGDFLKDTHLLQWLQSLPKFAAVVCWLIGTHYARGQNELIDYLKLPNPSDYRIHVQNEVYEIADLILKPGGILHLVDRGRIINNEELALLRSSHEDQASITSLIVGDIHQREYSEPKIGGTPMVAQTVDNELEHLTNSNRLLARLFSIVSVKP